MLRKWQEVSHTDIAGEIISPAFLPETEALPRWVCSYHGCFFGWALLQDPASAERLHRCDDSRVDLHCLALGGQFGGRDHFHHRWLHIHFGLSYKKWKIFD